MEECSRRPTPHASGRCEPSASRSSKRPSLSSFSGAWSSGYILPVAGHLLKVRQRPTLEDGAQFREPPRHRPIEGAAFASFEGEAGRRIPPSTEYMCRSAEAGTIRPMRATCPQPKRHHASPSSPLERGKRPQGGRRRLCTYPWIPANLKTSPSIAAQWDLPLLHSGFAGTGNRTASSRGGQGADRHQSRWMMRGCLNKAHNKPAGRLPYPVKRAARCKSFQARSCSQAGDEANPAQT